MRGRVRSYRDGPAITVVLQHDLTDAAYDLPLTLKTDVPTEWAAVDVRQGDRSLRVAIRRDGANAYVDYPAMPNAEDVTLTEAGAPAR